MISSERQNVTRDELIHKESEENGRKFFCYPQHVKF